MLSRDGTGTSAPQTSNDAGESSRFLSLLRFAAVLIQKNLHFVVPPGHFPADERSRNDPSGEVIIKEGLDAERPALLSRDIRHKLFELVFSDDIARPVARLVEIDGHITPDRGAVGLGPSEGRRLNGELHGILDRPIVAVKPQVAEGTNAAEGEHDKDELPAPRILVEQA